MDMYGKIWGKTGQLFATRYVQIHLLEIEAGGFCSEHRHARKHNFFHLLSGRVEIRVWQASSDGYKQSGQEEKENALRGITSPDVTTLAAGDSTTVAPGLFHQFVALERSLMLEAYEAAEVEEDIERRTHGGPE